MQNKKIDIVYSAHLCAEIDLITDHVVGYGIYSAPSHALTGYGNRMYAELFKFESSKGYGEAKEQMLAFIKDRWPTTIFPYVDDSKEAYMKRYDPRLSDKMAFPGK